MRSVVIRVLILSIVVLSVFPAVSAMAQEGPGTSSVVGDDLSAEAQGLFLAIDEKVQEVRRLRDQMSSASGEDTKALQKRNAELVVEVLADLDALVDNVTKREQDGVEVADDRTRVVEMVERVSTVLTGEIERIEGRLEEIRLTMDEASPEDQPGIDEDLVTMNAQLDRALDLLLSRIGVMEELDLPTEEVREFLSEHLEQRADLVAGRILLTKDRTVRLEKRLSVDPTNADFSTELDLESERLDRFVERLQTVTRMMESLGLETADYQQLLFEVTGEITTGLFSREVVGGLLKGWGQSTMDWITENGPSLILKVVLFVLILFIFRVLSRVARKVVRKAINRSNLQVSVLLERTALSVTGSVVMIFGVLVALSQLGFQVGPLLAGLGVVGFIVGFALQDTLSNFASGVMILLYRPYDVGDLIETAGAMGKVENMTLVSTTILTVDHQTLVIPNSMIWGNVIKNVTAQKERRIDMVFGIGYADDIPHAERVLAEIVEAHEQVLEDPEPVVKLHNLGESSVDFVVRPWVNTDDYWDVYWDITREVKIRFDAEGISIPFPQRDVHVFQEGDGGGA